MKIYLDMDGVLVDFVRGYLEYNNVDVPNTMKSWPKNEYKIENVVGSALTVPIDKLPKEFWANLKETPEMNTVLLYCLRCFHRNNLFILTAPTKHRDCVEGKLQWMDKHLKFMPKDKVIFDKDKWKYANPTSILIDDSDENVELFRKHGGYAILIPRIWNSAISIDLEEEIFKILKHYSGFSTVKNCSEF